ncbi:MAG: hypothetical protein ACON5O_07570 [Lentimonas sp.]
MQGKYVALILFILTGVVGGMFIVLGPKATERSPGVVHLGIRYSDEMTIAFTHYPKGGPGATIEFVAPDGSIAFTFKNLKVGRNLMPLEGVPNGPYTARLSAPDYQPVALPVVVEGRMINPPKNAELPAGTHADYNLIGVRFEKVAISN